MISVVIPLYNKAHTIERTLKSVIEQTYEDFEVIIINDGSTDNSIEVINKNFNDSRIKIYNQKNAGVSKARNNGVLNSSFEYIAFLDGDDDWDTKYLETAYDAIKSHPNVAMICTAGYIKDSINGNKILRLAKKYQNKISKIDYFENPHVFTHTSATIVSKKAFLEVPGGFPTDMKKNEDYALFFSLALVGETVYCGYPLSTYYGNIENQATQILSNDYSDIPKRINKTFEMWERTKKKNKTFIIFFKYELRHLILFLIKNNDYKNLLFILSNLSNEAVKNLYVFEKYIYSNKKLKNISIFYIYITKILWRNKKYPRLGEGN